MKNGLSADKMNKLLCDGIELEIFERLESTNKTAKESANNGAAEGRLIVAESQTGGRGRLGRKFFSPESGAYFSLVLRPNLNGEDLVLITATAAVAVCKAIEKLSGKKAEIKWVNDIFLNGKKVCGILTEASFNRNGIPNYVILGIGANISPPKDRFPKDIEQIAGTVFENRKDFERELFIVETINNFMSLYQDIFSFGIVREYKSRSIVLGKTVTFEKGGKKITAKAVDIDKRCRLVVQDGQRTEILSSGEVSIGSADFIRN